MNSGDTADRLCPLPVRPAPSAGEPADAYIRRLALANHLRPSYLRRYLAGPPSHLGAIQPERLAVLSGRTVAVLQRALTGLTRHTSQAPRTWPTALAPRRHTRAADKPALFAAIRRDAQQDEYPIRVLAARYGVHRRMIRQALAGPTPPPRKQPPQRATALDRLREPITAMLTTEPDLTARQIWERLFDHHDADISYDRVHHYVVRLRPGIPGTRPPGETAEQARSTETTPPAIRPLTAPPDRTSEAYVSNKIAHAGQRLTTGTFP